MTLFSIGKFDAHFGNAYREHVFLSHDLVPESTRQSRTKPYVIRTKTLLHALPNATYNENHVTFTPANQSVGAAPAEIREWFSGLELKVLVFDNLYGAFAGFANSMEFMSINHCLKQALIPCNYIQQGPCSDT